MSSDHKNKKRTLAKRENAFLRQLMGQMIYVLGASVHEMNRLIADGGKVSENTSIINEDYQTVLKELGIDGLEPVSNEAPTEATESA